MKKTIKNNSILDIPSKTKLIPKQKFLETNAKYKMLMRDFPDPSKDSPMEIYKWLEKLVSLAKSV